MVDSLSSKASPISSKVIGNGYVCLFKKSFCFFKRYSLTSKRVCCLFSRPFKNDLISTFHPELECNWPKWPELVAKELDMDCVNLADSGAGNEKIYSNISDYLTQPYAVRKGMTYHKPDIGLVVAAWSQGHRRDWSENFGKEGSKPW